MINFDERTHTYTDENGKELISVTTLLQKAGIGPRYGVVDEEVLQKAAAKGTLVHKEIEDYIKKGEIGFTKELAEFINYVTTNNIKVLASEKIVHNDNVAGTIDLIIQKPNGRISYVDFKTTSTIHIRYVSWQLSMYKDLDLNNDYENYRDYLDATLECWHFDKEGNLEVVEAEEIGTEHIEKLYENQGVYQLSVDESALQELYDAEQIIAYYEREKKKAEETAEKVRNKIIEAMKEQCINKYESDKIIITYTPASHTTRFDTNLFKEREPLLYKKYVKRVERKESVRITLKEAKDE